MNVEHAALRRQLLSVKAFDPDTSTFVVGNGHVGFGFVANPLAGVESATQDKLNMLLNLALPAGSMVQFALWASPDLEALLEAYRHQRVSARQAVLRTIVSDRARFLRQGTQSPVDPVSNIRLHDVRLIVTVKLPTPQRAPSDSEQREIDELRQGFAQTLKTIGFAAVPLTGALYARLMSTMLNHGPHASWRDSPESWYDAGQLLSDQILDRDTDIDLADAKQLKLGDKRVKLLHVRRYPEHVHFGAAIDYLTKFRAGDRGIRENVLITFNCYYPDQESKASKLETDRLVSTKQAQGRLAQLMPQLATRKADLDLIRGAVDDGDRVIEGYLGIAVFADSDSDAVSASANARSYFRELGFQLMEDAFFCGPLFFNLLPFKADPDARDALLRYHTFATRHAVPLLPVFGSWRGTGSPLLTLIARDGQVMPVSPFDSATNYNVCVAAQSGAGKSFLTATIITEARSRGELVRVIDVGRSYRNLCRLMGGVYLEFTRDADICLNPFTNVQDFDDEADVLTGILSTMAAPTQPLSDFQSSQLKRVLKEAFLKHGRALEIDHVAAALLAQPDVRMTDVGNQLFPFTSAGDYGRYFHGANNLDINNPFLVLELEELKARRHLQRVVLMQLMAQIQQEFYLGDRGLRKYLVIDEAWDLLAHADTRDFINASYRRVRKYNGCAVTITQSITDYWANAGALAIVENSANKYLLKQNAESINLAQKEGRLSCGAFGYELLKTVHTAQGEYSEILVMSDAGMGVGRLVVSDFQKLLYTTNPAEVAALLELERSGMSLTDAVADLARRRRGGRTASAA